MKVYANLFIDSKASVRVTKNSTYAHPNELAVQLVVDVPDVFFKRPMPRVELNIPEEYLVDPGKEIVAKWIAQDISDAIKIEAKTVEDGLVAMIKEQIKNESK